MAVLVADSTVTEAASVTSITGTIPGSTAAGDLLLAHVTGNVQSPPVTPPAGWTLLTSQAAASSGDNGSALFWRAAQAGDAGTGAVFTGASATANRMSVIVLRLTGQDSDPFDATPARSNAATGSTTYAAPGVTTATADALALWFITKNSSSTATITTTAGPTRVAHNNGTVALGRAQAAFTEPIPAPGATGTRLFSSSSSSQWTGIATAVRPATVAGPADTTAPTVPTQVVASPASPTSMTVTWMPSTDATGVASYRVQRGGVTVAAAVTGGSYLDTGLTPATAYSYTVSAVDPAGNRSAESAAASGTTPAAAAATLASVWTGVPVGDSVTIKTRTTSASSVRLKVATNAALTAGVVFTAAQAPTAAGYCTFAVTGLTAGQAYWYEPEVDGTPSGRVGRFAADQPGTPRSFRVAFGSCLTSGNTTRTAFDNALANNPELFLHLGDFHYGNSVSTSPATHRGLYEAQIAANGGLRDILGIPTGYGTSDHDSGQNDWTGGPGPQTPAWNAAYRELVPIEGTLPNAGGTYHSVHRGRVKFIITDGRSFKSPAAGTDDATKTMFGAAQESWIAAELADPAYPVKVLCVDVPWVYPTTAGDDKWGGYTAAADRLIAAVNATGARVFLIHGDAHSLCADDGTSLNNRGSLPVAGAAPLGNSTSVKGGPYSAGTWPTAANAGSVEQQHGLLDITDTGDSITIRFSGRDKANTERVTLTKTWSLAPRRAVDRWSGAGLLRQRVDRWDGVALAQRATERYTGGSLKSGGSLDGIDLVSPTAGALFAFRGGTKPVGATSTWNDDTINTHLNQWTVTFRDPGHKMDWTGDLDIAIGGVYPGEGDTWAEAAAGDYDARWGQAVEKIRGNRQPKAPAARTYIRFCHEFNIAQYPWKITDPSMLANFIAAFRRFHAVAKATFPEALVVWSPNRETSGSTIKSTDAWPGDAYVDVIGPDYYLQYPATMTQADWDAQLNQTDATGGPKGLGAWRAFAAAHGKPMCIPEFGANADFGDQAGGITAYLNYLEANQGTGPGQFLYANYFNTGRTGDAYNNRYGLTPDTRAPNMAAAYRAWHTAR